MSPFSRYGILRPYVDLGSNFMELIESVHPAKAAMRMAKNMAGNMPQHGTNSTAGKVLS